LTGFVFDKLASKQPLAQSAGTKLEAFLCYAHQTIYKETVMESITSE
jgi:hypothetical protein